MAQSEETQFLLQIKTNGNRYVDLAQCMTVVNKKQSHQTSAKGVPLCYAYTIQMLATTNAIHVLTAPRTWAVRNAVVKLHAGWKKQMKDAGFRAKDLSPYGRRLRLGFDDAAVDSQGSLVDSVQPHTLPSNSNDGNALAPVFVGYDTTAGTTVSYPLAGEVTTIVVPSDTEGSAPMELPAVLLSNTTAATSSIFRAVGQYLRSRNVMREDQAPDDSSLDPSNFMVRLFSGAQPETDEIVTEAQDFQEVRPYTMELDGSSNFASEFETSVSPLMEESSGTGEISVYSGVAPLGLICLGDIDGTAGASTATGDQYLVTVHAIYEM